MGIRLYFSNRLTALAAQLNQDLAKGNQLVFEPDLIVTQTEGMQQWLAMELAKNEAGIFANFVFKKPNDIVLDVAQMAKVTEHFNMSADKTRWIIYFQLAEKEFVERFSQVSRFYTNIEGGEVKRMQLASKIADLYDQMVIYRSNYISAWNEEKLLDPKDETEVWQAYIWRKMRSKIDNPLDRTQLKDKLVHILKSDPDFQQFLSRKLPKISVFGLSVLTNYHIEFFYELANHIEVNFYFLNPAPEQFWYDYKSAQEIQRLKYKYKKIDEKNFLIGNDLLTNWGKVGQHLYAELLAIDEFANGLQSIYIEEPEPVTLLGLVQNEIFHNRPPEEREEIPVEMLRDKSLQIMNCHSEAREVEVLYNFLVKTLSENDQIAPHDILVMVSNIENYSPYIQSIFDNAPYRISYSLADRNLEQSDELVNVLFALLELNNFEFTSEKVLQLVDYKIITNRYKLNDIGLIRRVVKEANIRFGWENKMDETETSIVSWQSGIERIVMGIAMKGEFMYDYNGKPTLCYDALEGNDAIEILNFIGFLKSIQQLIEDGREDRTLIEWRSYINQMAEKLLGDGVENEGLEMVMNRLDYLIELEELADEKIMRNVFVQSISSILNTNATNSGYLRGSITFCSTLPMCSIPFKVVAILGMNSLDFPRHDTPVGFDLIAKKPQKGDRSSKLNDKYLFLEALLSSENIFYLSYIGRSSKDNSHKEPSILIEELVNYIQQKSDENVQSELTVEHPLHGFSSKYNSSLFPDLYSFFKYNEEKKGLILAENESKKLEQSEQQSLSLDAFINACTQPIKHYFNATLGIYFSDKGVLVPENEVFELDNLSASFFKNALIKGEINEEQILLGKHRGTIPLANMGSVSLKLIEEEMEDFKGHFHNLTTGFVESKTQFEIELGNVFLFADLPIYLANNSCRQVIVAFSSNFGRNILSSWLKHLALVASGLDAETYLVAKNEKREISVFETTLSNKAVALEILASFEEFYLTATNELLFVDQNTCFSEFVKLKEGTDLLDFAENVFNKITGDYGPIKYDEYLQALDALEGLKIENPEKWFSLLESIYKPIQEYFLAKN